MSEQRGGGITKSMGVSLSYSIGLHIAVVMGLTYPGLSNYDLAQLSLNPGQKNIVQFDLIEEHAAIDPTPTLRAVTAAPAEPEPIVQPQMEKPIAAAPVPMNLSDQAQNPNPNLRPKPGVPTDGGGRAARDAQEAYIALIQNRLHSRLYYPPVAKRLGQHGRVMVEFRLDKSGHVLEAKLTEQTPFASINRAAMNLVEGIEALPPFPKEINKEAWTLRVPIIYAF